MARKRSGFTLIELAVVSGIICVLVALLLPAAAKAQALATQASRENIAANLTIEQVGDELFAVTFDRNYGEPRTITYIKKVLKLWKKKYPHLEIADVELVAMEGNRHVLTGMILIVREKEKKGELVEKPERE